MAGALVYLDASALVKLVVAEPESATLAELLAEGGPTVASIVVTVEIPRAIRRAGAAALMARASDVLSRVELLALDEEVTRVAAGLEPPDLRALDAIHLASALSLGEELGPFVCYDRRLAQAVRAGGLTGASAYSAGEWTEAGIPVVTDPVATLSGGRAGSGLLQRHAASFFQANRYLLPELVGHVLDAVPAAGEVIDLYAGVGLFSVSLAHSGRERITAVEGDRMGARDLAANAAGVS